MTTKHSRVLLQPKVYLACRISGLGKRERQRGIFYYQQAQAREKTNSLVARKPSPAAHS